MSHCKHKYTSVKYEVKPVEIAIVTRSISLVNKEGRWRREEYQNLLTWMVMGGIPVSTVTGRTKNTPFWIFDFRLLSS